MNVDQLGREAAEATRDAARQMPMRPIDQVAGRRRHRTWVASLVGIGTVVIAIVLAASLVGPEEAPVATDPSTVPEAPATTTAVTAAPATLPAPATTSTTVGAAPIIPVGGIAEQIVWFDGFTIGTGSPGGDPQPLADRQGDNFGLKMIADDGAGGFVILTGSSLEWWQAGSGEAATVNVAVDDQSLSVSRLLQVVQIDGVTYADVVFSRDADAVCTPMRGFVSLGDGSVPQGVIAVEGPLFGLSDGWVITDCGMTPPTINAAGRSVTLDVPEYTNLDPESGAPLNPIPVTQLVMTDSNGAEAARIDVTTDNEPFAVLHDFDGRRVLVSREAWEPALAPRTFFVIDLDCADCGLGEPFTTGRSASADLTPAPG